MQKKIYKRINATKLYNLMKFLSYFLICLNYKTNMAFVQTGVMETTDFKSLGNKVFNNALCFVPLGKLFGSTGILKPCYLNFQDQAPPPFNYLPFS